MSNNTSLVIYPRGFAGVNIGLPVRYEKSTIEERIVRLHNASINSKRDRTLVFNDKVESLYTAYKHRTIKLSDLSLLEKTIVVALEAFGTDNFLEWARLQESSPSFSERHVRFLNDTFQFIQEGKRSISLKVWDSILEVPGGEKSEIKVTYDYRSYFELDGSLTSRRSLLLSDHIRYWLEKTNGLDDLINTLHILFGYR